MTRRSRQTKSTMKSPRGNCRRHFVSASLRSRKRRQSPFLGSVGSRRIARARVLARRATGRWKVVIRVLRSVNFENGVEKLAANYIVRGARAPTPHPPPPPPPHARGGHVGHAPPKQTTHT